MATNETFRELPTLVWERLNGAIAGDVEKAREVLGAIALNILETEPSWWRELAAEMFMRVAHGEIADDSLMIAPSGRPKKPRSVDFRIWLAVRHLKDRGMHATPAYKEVAADENRLYPRVTKLSDVEKPITWSRVRQIYLAQMEIYEGRVSLTQRMRDNAAAEIDSTLETL